MTPEARERRRIRRPVLAVTAVAWAVILLEGSLPSASLGGQDPASHQEGPVATGHAHHATGDAGLSALHGSSEIAGGVVFGWVLMLTAMMAPLLIPALRHARARSLRSRRCRAMSLVAVAAAAVWTVGGAVLLAVAAALRAITEDAGLALMLGLVAVVIWQCSPLKQYCLNRHCAGPPIAAFGAAADRDALRFGTTHAAWCLGSCWGLMLMPVLAPAWHEPVMLAVAAWMWVEPLDRPERPTWRVRLPLRFLRIARAGLRPLAPAPAIRAGASAGLR